MVREMSGRGNIRSGKYLSGEISGRGSLHRANVRRGSVRRGSVSRGSVLGELSVQELSSQGTVRIPPWVGACWVFCQLQKREIYYKGGICVTRDVTLAVACNHS